MTGQLMARPFPTPGSLVELAHRELQRAANGTSDQILALGRDHDLDPPTRQRVATLVARATAYQALAHRQRDQGGAIASTASSLLKLGITEMMFEFAVLRADIAGATSMVDGPPGAGLLAAPGGRIAGGTSQVQRNIIGERVLGLPKEPGPDKETPFKDLLVNR